MSLTSNFRFSLASLTLLLLAGCSQVQGPLQAAPSFASTATVTLRAGDTRASVEEASHGQVLVWRPEAGFAVLGLTGGAQAGLHAQAVGGAQVEDNLGMITGGGATSAWNAPGVAASGRAYFWGGGRAYFWGGGRAYFWGGGAGVVGGLSENSALWKQTNLKGAWALAPRLGEGVTVAIIDTGLDQGHEAFQASLVPASQRWDFVGQDADPQEEGTFDDALYGHGTNVAGIVLQVAPHARIMPIRALRPDGSGDTTSVVQAIDWAVEHGAQVINLSLGSVQKTGVLKRMINYATEQGVYVVASSGNSGDRHITYPARYGQEGGRLGALSLGVGSVDAQDRKSSFSTYGRELEVTAPGEQVFGPVPGNLVSSWSGTSMAAPMVSGSLALALGQPLKVKAQELTDQLVKSGDDVSRLNQPYRDELGRRLNIGAFIEAAVRP
ncbi:S8 family serine peptidase [Deinococcus koreensis]|uniref:Peptidase S8 and S53 subtilisin kexin sedolisin n=1 Tax=Deinococcus koreensis TaxID=2054903 RepID=A0A2K3USL0_9DEIO|nr:S8 family serine peptidase [Deinococcus koreensis]PNY79526.1 peptidase S8 and S53 subtilisin kexin sedolisin [Deinococcus koreensis]